MIKTLPGVCRLILDLMTLFQGERCVRNINCKSCCFLHSCPVSVMQAAWLDATHIVLKLLRQCKPLQQRICENVHRRRGGQFFHPTAKLKCLAKPQRTTVFCPKYYPPKIAYKLKLFFLKRTSLHLSCEILPLLQNSVQAQ